MSQNQWYLIAVAAILVILQPLVPRMIAFRILVLKKLHLNWMVGIHERHFGAWVMFIRVILGIIAAALLYAALSQ